MGQLMVILDIFPECVSFLTYILMVVNTRQFHVQLIQLPIYLSFLELFTSFPPKTFCSSSSTSELSFEDLAPLLMHSGCIQCNNIINVSSVESGTIIYSVIGNVLNWKFGGIRNGLI